MYLSLVYFVFKRKNKKIIDFFIHFIFSVGRHIEIKMDKFLKRNSFEKQ